MATVNFKGSPVKLGGNEVNVGDIAPEAILPNKGLTDVTIGGAKGVTQILVAVPSLDTAVCATEARKFNTESANLEKCEVKIISMDLPFAAGRFCTTEGIENVETLSDFRDKNFANTYGLLIEEGALRGLTARAIFVIDKNGTVVYKELVPEVTAEPNYEAALSAAKSISSSCCGGGCH